jgi:hypothetical protein
MDLFSNFLLTLKHNVNNKYSSFKVLSLKNMNYKILITSCASAIKFWMSTYKLATPVAFL